MWWVSERAEAMSYKGGFYHDGILYGDEPIEVETKAATFGKPTVFAHCASKACDAILVVRDGGLLSRCPDCGNDSWYLKLMTPVTVG